MFDFNYDNIPQDEYEARALKELMGLNIELPKARLLKILRDNGGDADAASAAAFMEMRELYRKQFGEKDEDDDGGDDDNQQSASAAAATDMGERADSKVVFAVDQNTFDFNGGGMDMDYGYGYGYDGRQGSGEKHHANNDGGGMQAVGRPGSFDMCFEAFDKDAATGTAGNNNNNDDDDDEQRPLHEYMLRVRSKEIYSNNYDDDSDDGGFDDCCAPAAMAHAVADDDHDNSGPVDQSSYYNSSAGGGGGGGGGGRGIYMKSFCHGGWAGPRNGKRDKDGELPYPVAFLNEGIRIIRLDTPGSTHETSVSVVNTAELDDEDFEALCEDWLNERYDNYEMPDSFLEDDFERAKAKDVHDRELFDLYCEFEKSLRGGFSLEGGLSTFNAANAKVQKQYRVALGLDKDEDEEAAKKAAAAKLASKPDVIDASTKKNFFRGGTEARYGAVGKHVSDVSRTFRVSMALPRTCTVTRVEVVRNTYLERRFDRYCDALQKNGIAFNIGTGYHGTTEQAIGRIVEEGFYCPLEHQKLSHKSGNNGFYGNGNYQSPDPNIAFWYSQGSKMLVTKCARGRVYKCPGMMMGVDLQANSDSHESPDGSEWVFYNSAQVLPIAIIHFSVQSARPSATVVTKATIRGRAAADMRADLDAKAGGGAGGHMSNKTRRTLNRIAGGAQGQRGKSKRGK